MAEKRFGTFDQLMAQTDASLRPIAKRLPGAWKGGGLVRSGNRVPVPVGLTQVRVV